MCTISFIPNFREKEGFFITSNRDESVNRPAERPKIYVGSGTQLYYPKDKRAGGTWIGVSKRERFLSLMNGAFRRHKRLPYYKKSRGIVVKELLAAKDIFKTIHYYDFGGIEPFFSLLISWEKQVQLFELVWDGKDIFLQSKDKNQPHIWSSMMSYSIEQHQKKEDRFRTFLEQHQKITPELLWQFHHIRHFGKDEGILVHRGEMQTTSISQFQHFSKRNDYFYFESLINHKEQKEELVWKDLS